jgi:hypothetical protein
MSAHHESPAVALAQAHVEARSNHDFDAARRSPAPGVQVTSTTTQPIMKDIRTTGIDDYMRGLIAFAQGVVPGSARVLASTTDGRNALLLVTVEGDLGGGRWSCLRPGCTGSTTTTRSRASRSSSTRLAVR